jgi:hypothetical protein
MACLVRPPSSCCNSPQWARASSLYRLHDHIQSYHSRQDSSGWGISLSQNLRQADPQPDNPQWSQEANIDAQAGFDPRITSKRAAADKRLRPRGHWDRSHSSIQLQYVTRQYQCIPLSYQIRIQQARAATDSIVTGQRNLRATQQWQIRESMSRGGRYDST